MCGSKKMISFGSDIAICCMDLQACVRYLALVFAERPWTTRDVDDGSDPGRLVRMPRDVDFAARAYDHYAPNAAVADSDGDLDRRYNLLVAIETLEHVALSAVETDRLFEPGRDLVVVRTRPYRNEGPDRYYSVCELGQHAFFYS